MIEAATAPHCAAQRKRGAALEDAIREAAYAELTEVGYAQFSFESVAARARTGKASIYRRWQTKQALVLDSLCAGLPTPQQCGIAADIDTGISTADATSPTMAPPRPRDEGGHALRGHHQ